MKNYQEVFYQQIIPQTKLLWKFPEEIEDQGLCSSPLTISKAKGQRKISSSSQKMTQVPVFKMYLAKIKKKKRAILQTKQQMK